MDVILVSTLLQVGTALPVSDLTFSGETVRTSTVLRVENWCAALVFLTPCLWADTWVGAALWT